MTIESDDDLVYIKRLKQDNPELYNLMGIFVDEELDPQTGALKGHIGGAPAIGLCTLEVFEPHRRQGVGKRLLDAYIEYCKQRGLPRVVFTCSSSNLAALALYRSRGFDMTVSEESGALGDVVCTLMFQK
jgi:ribosomal protein S18 acetylase RimI-like enzyme